MRRSLKLAVFVVAVVLVGLSSAQAGLIQYVPINNDGDSEISSSKVYTHAIDFGTSPVATINGVGFTQGLIGSLPPDFSFEVVPPGTGTPSSHGGNGNHNVSGNLVDLMTDMIYTGSNSAGAVSRATISGLGVGQLYDARIYTRAWSGGPGSRTATITFDPDGAGPVADAVTLSQDNAAANPPGFGSFNQAYAISYRFEAQQPELTIDFEQTAYNASWHVYGLTNQLVRGVAIQDLFNTGVASDDNDGLNATLVADGDPDPHYSFVSGPQSPSTAPQAQVQANHPAWRANGPDSKWIGVSPAGTTGDPPGTYIYETAFTIPTGVNAGSAEVTGYWFADDGGEIFLNGTSTGITGGAPFNAALPGTPFTIQHGDGGAAFVTGTNTLRFVTTNGGTGPNPHGLRVNQVAGAHAPAPLGTPILDLYNTGVVSDDEFGVNSTLLAPGQADPHYRFVSGPQSPPTAPQAQVQSNHPAWAASGPDSMWIGVSPAGTTGDQPGTYQYETTFTLPAGVNAATAQITGNWWVDDSNASTQIFLNGTNTGTSGTAPFNAALPGTPFTIDYNSGGAVFLTGTNTLTFQVVNGAAGPHGLRVNQLAGRHQAASSRVPIGDLFNTGVVTDDEFGVNSTMLADGDPDPHYRFVTGPQNPSTAPQAQVQLNHPAWSGNGPDSKWIGVSPLGTADDATGTYQYETTFTIPAGLDASTAEIAGYMWADDGAQIFLNGTNVGFGGTAPYGAPYPGTPFTIGYGNGGAVFLTGTNTLRFDVSNAGTSANPQGLRVTRMAGSLDPTDPNRVPIADLFNTGVATDDQFGVNAVLLADGDPDPHYAFASGPQSPPTAPQAQVQLNHPAWSGNGPDSKWIGVSDVGANAVAGGTYQYETTFTIPLGFDPESAEISGYWWVDDSDITTQILLNGVDTGTSGTAPYGAAYPGTFFSIADGDGGAHFLSGTNSLLFQVLNGGQNPHGLRVTRLAGSYAVPEPGSFATLLLGGLGLLGYGLLRRKRVR